MVFSRIENFENLFFVSLGVVGHFLARQLLARFGLSRRIADHAGEITDQKNDFMTRAPGTVSFSGSTQYGPDANPARSDRSPL